MVADLRESIRPRVRAHMDMHMHTHAHAHTRAHTHHKHAHTQMRGVLLVYVFNSILGIVMLVADYDCADDE